LQYKLIVETFPAFISGVKESKNFEELRKPSQRLFDTIMEVVYADQVMIMKAKD
jgi:hypothetical protein